LDDSAFNETGKGDEEAVVFDLFVEEVEFGLLFCVFVGDLFEGDLFLGFDGFGFFLNVFHI
jgi:hypothetical protein